MDDTPLDLGPEDLLDSLQKSAARVSKPRLSKLVEENMSMNEIGPRFVLVPIKIFEGSFGGATIWENAGKLNQASKSDLAADIIVVAADFITPTAKLANTKLLKATEYKGRKNADAVRKDRKEYLHVQEQANHVSSGRAALSKRRVFA